MDAHVLVGTFGPGLCIEDGVNGNTGGALRRGTRRDMERCDQMPIDEHPIGVDSQLSDYRWWIYFQRGTADCTQKATRGRASGCVGVARL